MEAGRHAALLLMDLQRGIVDRFAGEDPGYLARIGTVAAAARRADIPVIWVVVRFRSGFPEVSPRNRMFGAIAARGALAEGDAAAEIHPAIAVEPQDLVVAKRRVSAFAGSDLEVVLRARGIDSLVLAGIATGGVVLSTLRQAADMDFDLTVLADGCLDADAEVHRVLLERVFPRQAAVTTVAAWAEARAPS